MDDSQISCGCCRGPENDRCTCHNHQDIRIGRPARRCARHKPLSQSDIWKAREADLNKRLETIRDSNITAHAFEADQIIRELARRVGCAS